MIGKTFHFSEVHLCGKLYVYVRSVAVCTVIVLAKLKLPTRA